MDVAAYLLVAISAMVFAVGFMIGRGRQGDRNRLEQELAEKDQALDDIVAGNQLYVDQLNTVTEDLHATLHERDERSAFISYLRSDRAFEAWQRSSVDGQGVGPVSADEIREWMEIGLGLVEGSDFQVRPVVAGHESPDFVRFHMGFSWVIQTRDLVNPEALHNRLTQMVDADTSLLTSSIQGHTNLGHMVLVSSPEVTANGIMPVGYKRHEPLFLAVHDWSGFVAADDAMCTLASRLTGAGTKVDPHHISLQANDVIRQGQAQIRAGQQLVMLGEAIRQNLIGTIPLSLLDAEGDFTVDELMDAATDGSTTMRMKPLPGFNPMESNPAPLAVGGDEFNLSAQITQFDDYAEYLEEDLALGIYDADSDLLDRLDEREREAFSLSQSVPLPIIKLAEIHSSEADAAEQGRREDPPTFV